MRRALRPVALTLLILGVFWVGRESTHGVHAFWEHWWCPIPVALVLLGVTGMLVPRQRSALA